MSYGWYWWEIENMTLVTIIEMPSVVPLYGNMDLYHACHNDDIDDCHIDDIDEYNVEIVCYWGAWYKEMVTRVFSCSCTQMTRMSIQASRESEFIICFSPILSSCSSTLWSKLTQVHVHASQEPLRWLWGQHHRQWERVHKESQLPGEVHHQRPEWVLKN